MLESARAVRHWPTDASMIEDALRALIARHRSAEIDVSYTAYDAHPLDEPDQWGDLASFREAVARS